MNLRRTTTIVLAGAAVGVWLAGAATSNHRSRAADRATRRDRIARRRARERNRAPAGASAADLVAAPAGTQPVRFPRRGAARAAEPPFAPPPALPDAAPLAPALPSLKLAGIAEDIEADGPIRTAIISGEGQLYMVKEGEAVTPRYRVTKISADVVELVDLSDNSAALGSR